MQKNPIERRIREFSHTDICKGRPYLECHCVVLELMLLLAMNLCTGQISAGLLYWSKARRGPFTFSEPPDARRLGKGAPRCTPLPTTAVELLCVCALFNCFVLRLMVFCFYWSFVEVFWENVVFGWLVWKHMHGFLLFCLYKFIGIYFFGKKIIFGNVGIDLQMHFYIEFDLIVIYTWDLI